MAQSIVGLENVQPYKFSECSKNDYIDLLRMSHGGCMMNKPNEVSTDSVCAFFLFISPIANANRKVETLHISN